MTNWRTIAFVVGGAGLLAVTGGIAAPFIGAAIGGALGLSGAAATSAGLATIGFGSIASGGLGMAGGAAIVTAGSGILGTTLCGATACATKQT